MKTTVESIRRNNEARIRLKGHGGKPPTLDPEVLDALDSILDKLEKDLPRLVIVEGEPERWFCAGANINVLKTLDATNITKWVLRGHEVFNRLANLECPVIARVTGYALGGGLELAMACDLIFATDQAIFGQTEARLGFIPGWGGTFRLAQRTGHAKAKLFFFSAETIPATTALSIGLADYVGSQKEVDDAIEKIAAAIEGNSPYALSAFKRITNYQTKNQCETGAQLEAEFSQGCLQNPDTHERIQAFLNRKK